MTSKGAPGDLRLVARVERAAIVVDGAPLSHVAPSSRSPPYLKHSSDPLSGLKPANGVGFAGAGRLGGSRHSSFGSACEDEDEDEEDAKSSSNGRRTVDGGVSLGGKGSIGGTVSGWGLKESWAQLFTGTVDAAQGQDRVAVYLVSAALTGDSLAENVGLEEREQERGQEREASASCAWRRFSDFVRLSKLLSAVHVNVPELPPKTVFTSLAPQHIEARRQALSLYLRKLTNRPDIIRSRIFHEFLNLHTSHTSHTSHTPHTLHTLNTPQMTQSPQVRFTAHVTALLEPLLCPFGAAQPLVDILGLRVTHALAVDSEALDSVAGAVDSDSTTSTGTSSDSECDPSSRLIPRIHLYLVLAIECPKALSYGEPYGSIILLARFSLDKNQSSQKPGVSHKVSGNPHTGAGSHTLSGLRAFPARSGVSFIHPVCQNSGSDFGACHFVIGHLDGSIHILRPKPPSNKSTTSAEGFRSSGGLSPSAGVPRPLRAGSDKRDYNRGAIHSSGGRKPFAGVNLSARVNLCAAFYDRQGRHRLGSTAFPIPNPFRPFSATAGLGGRGGRNVEGTMASVHGSQAQKDRSQARSHCHFEMVDGPVLQRGPVSSSTSEPRLLFAQHLRAPAKRACHDDECAAGCVDVHTPVWVCVTADCLIRVYQNTVLATGWCVPLPAPVTAAGGDWQSNVFAIAMANDQLAAFDFSSLLDADALGAEAHAQIGAACLIAQTALPRTAAPVVSVRFQPRPLEPGSNREISVTSITRTGAIYLHELVIPAGTSSAGNVPHSQPHTGKSLVTGKSLAGSPRRASSPMTNGTAPTTPPTSPCRTEITRSSELEVEADTETEAETEAETAALMNKVLAVPKPADQRPNQAVQRLPSMTLDSSFLRPTNSVPCAIAMNESRGKQSIFVGAGNGVVSQLSLESGDPLMAISLTPRLPSLAATQNRKTGFTKEDAVLLCHPLPLDLEGQTAV